MYSAWCSWYKVRPLYTFLNIKIEFPFAIYYLAVNFFSLLTLLTCIRLTLNHHPILIVAHCSHYHSSFTFQLHAESAFTTDNPSACTLRPPDKFHDASLHCSSHELLVYDDVPFMQYGVHNMCILDKYYYYDPVLQNWVNRTSGQPTR